MCCVYHSKLQLIRFLKFLTLTPNPNPLRYQICLLFLLFWVCLSVLIFLGDFIWLWMNTVHTFCFSSYWAHPSFILFGLRKLCINHIIPMYVLSIQLLLFQEKKIKQQNQAAFFKNKNFLYIMWSNGMDSKLDVGVKRKSKLFLFMLWHVSTHHNEINQHNN